jgi:crotonobetainyl-CoA:carnitine CoA-transferase CaiB-like acyl-CoA transferase
MNYPEIGEIPVPGIPVKLSLTPGSINIPSPKLGEHNKEVYGGLLGFSSQRLSRLKREGVI